MFKSSRRYQEDIKVHDILGRLSSKRSSSLPHIIIIYNTKIVEQKYTQIHRDVALLLCSPDIKQRLEKTEI